MTVKKLGEASMMNFLCIKGRSIAAFCFQTEKLAREGICMQKAGDDALMSFTPTQVYTLRNLHEAHDAC
jgi:hypothetical protein